MAVVHSRSLLGSTVVRQHGAWPRATPAYLKATTPPTRGRRRAAPEYLHTAADGSIRSARDRDCAPGQRRADGAARAAAVCRVRESFLGSIEAGAHLSGRPPGPSSGSIDRWSGRMHAQYSWRRAAPSHAHGNRCMRRNAERLMIRTRVLVNDCASSVWLPGRNFVDDMHQPIRRARAAAHVI